MTHKDKQVFIASMAIVIGFIIVSLCLISGGL